MLLVPAKCTQRGSNLNVYVFQEAAVCPFCHTLFITEKAIHNYNITKQQLDAGRAAIRESGR